MSRTTSKKYRHEFNTLMRSKDVAVYQEPEQKFDIPTESGLEAVEKFICENEYLIPINDPRSSYDIPRGIHIDSSVINNFKIRPAREDTPRRFRVYYDTPSLDAYRGDVEIRIEFPKPTEHGHKKLYKQVVKLGGAATPEDPIFHRIEVSGRVSRPVPSFEPSALDGNEKLSSFLKKHIKCDDLRPLQVLTTMRTRFYFHASDDRATTVEIASDRGRGIALNGERFPILQMELEVLNGDNNVLNVIASQLKNRFNGLLTPNLTSKPTPGYEALTPLLTGNKKARSFVKNLKRDEFRIVAPHECPELFMR
jgi:hypothetical protein